MAFPKKRKTPKPEAQIVAVGNSTLGHLQSSIERVPAPPITNLILQEAMQRVKAQLDTMPPRSDPIRWMEQNYYIPETKRPIRFEPYQKRALREALSLDENGLFKYATIVWVDLKKSGKTTVAAATIDWMMSEMPGSTAKIVANDLDQADSRAAKMLRTNFKLHPRQGVQVLESRNLIKYPNGSEVQSIAIDPSGEAGGNDNVIAFDELWGAHEKAKERMWTEMTLSPLKAGKSFRLVTSYAGYLGESNLLWNLYLQGVDGEAQFPGVGKRFDWAYEFDPPLECYYNPQAKLFCLWNTVPRCPWQTPEYYATESATITIQSEFNRIHRNQWATAVESFLPIEWYDSCRVEVLPKVDHDTYYIVAIDAAVSSDCFGIVMLSRHGDNIAVRYAREWTPQPGQKLEFVNLDDPTDRNYPEGELRYLYDNYNVLEFCYDPMHLSELPTRLMRDGKGLYKQFLQGKDRAIADKQLHDLIAKRGLLHDGSHSNLRSHLQNANKEIRADKTIRLVKRAPTLHIDLAVCASMGVARALHYRLG